MSVATAQNFVFGLRAFLRFCFLEALMDTDLSEAALPVTGRRRFALPRGSPTPTSRQSWQAAIAARRWAAGTTRS
ncbi:MAG TPA: hypothetical protein VF482_03780 [Trebonia sp.]